MIVESFGGEDITSTQLKAYWFLRRKSLKENENSDDDFNSQQIWYEESNGNIALPPLHDHVVFIDLDNYR